MATLTVPAAYTRATTFTQATGLAALPKRGDAYIISLIARAKLERIQKARMSYKMRLNAMVSADSRKGKLWN